MADHSDDLDQLLDSALDDFLNLNLTASAQRGSSNSGDNSGDGKKECSTMTSESVQALGMGLPDLNIKKNGKQKVMGLPDLKIQKKGKQKVPPPKQDPHILEALDKLREQTKEAVKGLESVTGPRPPLEGNTFGEDAMIEDWVKHFEEHFGSQDMESVVETMMQQLLSKEILHEPMKEIGERYPLWLQENKHKLTDEEYIQYSNQYELIKDLNRVYETEPDNFNKIVELMQKMQECGQPPNDIMQELAPGLDLSTFGQLSPEMLESQQNCRIM